MASSSSAEDENTAKRTARAPRQGKEHPDEELKGLCMNCAHRWICAYPKPEGGIWHCEEYAEDR